MIQAAHWQDALALGSWRWLPWFSPREMACGHCGALVAHEPFMDRLVALRQAHGRPMQVISGYRCKAHPLEVVKDSPGTGPHCRGRAIDPGVAQDDVGRVMRLAREAGFTRCGLRFGVAGFQLHLDDLPCERADGDLMLWPY